MLLRFALAAAFIKRVQYRVRWRRRWLVLSQRTLENIEPHQLQQALIELCVFEACRPAYISPLLSADSDSDSEW